MADSMQILVVEDEPIIADDLVFMLEEMGYPKVENIYNGDHALEAVKKNHYDLVLLDINLEGGVDGVQIAEYLNETKKSPFIFLTSLSDEKTLERVKKTYPAAYLVKPIDEKDLRVNIELTLYGFNEENSDEDKTYPDSFYVKDRTKMSKVVVDEILYLEGSNNYTLIHTSSKKYVISQTLKHVQKSVDPERFTRIHKSIIINLDKIEEIESSHVKIGENRLPIGRTYRSNFLEKLNTI